MSAKLIQLCTILNTILIAYGLYHCMNEMKYRRYYKVRSCYRSNGTLVARNNFPSVKDCMKYSREKKGLAFNYSPQDAKINQKNKDNYAYNCQVLGCPEISDIKTLLNDTGFDYYSAYGNLSVLENATCIRSVGLFRLFETKLNYSNAIEKCQDIGGDLAMVHTDLRTNALSGLVKSGIRDWYRVAYIGMDDRRQESEFETPLGDPISQCFKFRAWAPGHPRNKYKHEDCGIIDTEKTWRVVNCKEELPFICEYYATEPRRFLQNTTFLDVYCDDFDTDEDIKNCEIYQSNKEDYDNGEGDRCTAHLYKTQNNNNNNNNNDDGDSDTSDKDINDSENDNGENNSSNDDIDNNGVKDGNNDKNGGNNDNADNNDNTDGNNNKDDNDDNNPPVIDKDISEDNKNNEKDFIDKSKAPNNERGMDDKYSS